MTNIPRQLTLKATHLLLIFLLSWNWHNQQSVSAQGIPQGLKGEKGEPGIAGKDGKDCIPPLPQPGSPVHIGGGRYKILEGAQGPRGSAPFNPALGGKGDKGDMGQPGPAGPVGPPGICDSSQCGTSSGSCSFSKDCIGQKGEPGPAGPKGEAGQRGPRGSPGLDGRGLDRIIHYGYGAIIVETANDLEEIADYMPGGSIVLVRRGNTYGPELHMKVGYPENLWRQISMGFGREIQYRKLSTPQKPMLKVARFRNSAPLKAPNQKLILVTLEEPWRGNVQARVAGYKCNERARAVGLPGYFQPFLDSVAQKLEFILPAKYGHLPIVNARGELLFKNWTSMFQGDKKRPRVPMLTFDGLNVMEYEPWRPKYLWVGTSNEESGNNEVSCRDWTSSKPMDFGMALDLKSDAFLKELSPLPCGNAYYIACIQVTL